MHAKVFSIQIFQYFRQILPRVCTLVLFILQALVDHEYKFMYTYVGWPGSVHDACIFSNSDLYAKGESSELMPNVIKHINKVDVPVMILGDAAYPMLPWIMKPYPGTGTLSRKQYHFNYRRAEPAWLWNVHLDA